jgi:endo-1,4-beta-xylanase
MPSASAETLLLWPHGAPGSEGRTSPEVVRLSEKGEHIVSGIHAPSLTLQLPHGVASTGAAVVVLPGGGHHELWMDHEGYRVADMLAAHGVAAFILKYRLSDEPNSPYTIEKHSLADVSRAIRIVRSRAAEWGVDPARIGVMGFSAGGELAALSASRFDGGAPEATDVIERASSRPDFQILVYPGLSHHPTISRTSPPAFLLCGGADGPAISQGLADLYLEFARANVPAELHIYAGVGHGFGIRPTDHGPVTEWPQRLIDWLGAQGFLAPR